MSGNEGGGWSPLTVWLNTAATLASALLAGAALVIALIALLS